MKKKFQGRTSSYGEHGLTLIDRMGVYMSKRKILQSLQGRGNLTVLDIGCGYNAQILTALLPDLKEGTGIDVTVSDQAKAFKEISFIEGDIEQILPELPDDKFDLILMISVLEHLWNPQEVLAQSYKILKPGGVFLINVPTWRGKYFLELSAFKFGTSPACEMDDHKMYYDKQNIWPLLVHAGFKPSAIDLRYIKFGLNLFAHVTR